MVAHRVSTMVVDPLPPLAVQKGTLAPATMHRVVPVVLPQPNQATRALRVGRYQASAGHARLGAVEPEVALLVLQAPGAELGVLFPGRQAACKEMGQVGEEAQGQIFSSD